ncbi:porin [Planktomarina temperata]|nr:porin [Planktomarina temperata]
MMTAGVAAAEVTFSGTAKFGYNDTDHATGASVGAAFSDIDLNIAFSQELNNGYTAAASFEFDVANADQGASFNASDAVISLTNSDSSIHYGDTKHGAENAWSAVGSMDNDDFRVAKNEMVTRADMTFGGAKIGISLGDDTNISGTEKDYISLGITGSAGAFSYALAHQNENTATLDPVDNLAATQLATTGVRVSTTLGGATVALGYAKNDNGGSTGIEVSYPMGALTTTASYVQEGAASAENKWDVKVAYAEGALGVTVATDESQDWNVDVSYDMGNGMNLFVGADDGGKDTYAGVSYDLGGGASLLASYANDSDNDDTDDEVGAKDYKEGMTFQLSFAF